MVRNTFNTPGALTIAIDFGTTFTGVAYAYQDAKDLEVITTWPGNGGICTDKVASEFVYLESSLGPTSEFRARDIRYGYELGPEEARIRCIKLLLDGNQRLPSFVNTVDVWSLLGKANRNTEDAVADYLTKIRLHTISTLHKRFTESFVSSTVLKYILTVPAVWSDASKHATREAARKAGMGRDPLMISEPKAAAIYALKVIQPNHLDIGENLVICDAGGGTVDLITHRIKALEPLAVEETIVGTGGLCGSAFLNHGFENLLKVKLGSHIFQTKVKQKPRVWEPALKKSEESIKRQFSEDDGNKTFNIPLIGLPDDANLGIDEGYLSLTGKEIKSIFDPVIEPIIKLVDDQIASVHARGENVSAVLLVGGFGQPAYLYKQLEKHL